jgi:chemotaxis protein methyltransferase CheR
MSLNSIVDDPSLSDREFKAVQSLIYQHAGIALADSKHVMVQSRLAKHVRRLQLDSYADYLRFLDQVDNGDEVILFINALTTNKTDFFREKHHFDFLLEKAFPEIKRRAENGGKRRLRIWCSASSTGEEPYTIAMCVREFFAEDPTWDIRILASDIDTEVLSKAQEGLYEAERFLDVEPYFAKKYFEKQGRDAGSPASVKPTLRNLITFRRLNLMDDQWPINTTFDIIFCRNVMIYFNRTSQTKIVNHFADYLDPSGHLLIGHSESLFGISDRFKSLGDTIYARGNTGANSGAPATKPANRLDSATLSGESRTGAPTSSERERLMPSNVHHAASASANESESLVDSTEDDPKTSIIIGEVFSSAEPMWITTLLGSCVAVCLYDDVAKVGGMNHFMLPTPSDRSISSTSYGVHSMELLVNSVLASGGDRRRLKAKLFGGGKVIRTSSKYDRIGATNVEFAEKVLATENIPIIARLTDHDGGMNVRFHTHTNKVIVRILEPEVAEKIQRRDATLSAELQKRLAESTEVTMFLLDQIDE